MNRCLSSIAAASLLFATGCGPRPAEPPATAPATTAPSANTAAPAPSAAETAKPAAIAPPPWVMEPIPTAVAGADGCKVSSWLAGITLSVNGEVDGVFLPRLSGAKGEVVIVPGGRSAARVTFGAAVFDTGLSLAESSFALKDRPPPLGGVLYPDRYASFRVAGGDKARLSMELTGNLASRIEWTAPTRVEVPCEGLKRGGQWADAPALPDTKSDVYPSAEFVGVRAKKTGPVVAKIAVEHAGVAETSGTSIKVVAFIRGVGTVVGWSDAADWKGQPPSKPSPGLGSGMGMLGAGQVDCPRGTPLYVRKNDKLYEVGHLRDDAPLPDNDNAKSDWRLLRPEVRLDKAPESLPDSVPWVVLREDFRVTNYFWHDGVAGAFVVPKGPSACKIVR